MGSFRDIKRQARRVVHDTMQVAALYVSDPTDPLVVPQLVSARIHWTFRKTGWLKGTTFHTVEREEVQPLAIFLVTEVMKPKRGAAISIGLGDAYIVDHCNPPDDITVTAEIFKADLAQANLLPIRAIYIADQTGAPDVQLPVLVRVNFQTTTHQIVFDAAQVPSPAIGATVSLAAGLAYTITGIVSGVTATAFLIPPDATYGLPVP